MVNIRGLSFKSRNNKRMVSGNVKECIDCEGCICEEFCNEKQEKYFPAKEGEKDG